MLSIINHIIYIFVFSIFMNVRIYLYMLFNDLYIVNIEKNH